MKPELLFQRLVICSTAFFVGWVSLYWTLEPRLPDATRRALEWNGYGAKLPLSATILWFVALMRVLIAVGLCQFSREARAAFVSVEVFYGVASLLGGLTVSTATGVFLGYLMNLSEGAVLVMAFTPPLRDKFTNMRREEPSGEPQVSATDGQNGATKPPEQGS